MAIALKNNKKQNKNKQKKTVAKKNSALNFVKKRWIARKKTFSPYPYILTISYYKSNVFFTVADIEGRTKGWTSTGRSGFKNKDKTTYMAIVKVTELFFKKIWSLGIRHVILKLKNVYQRSTRFAIRKSLRKTRKLYPLKYLGILFQMQIAFNGCRKKKKDGNKHFRLHVSRFLLFIFLYIKDKKSISKDFIKLPNERRILEHDHVDLNHQTVLNVKKQQILPYL